MTRNQAWIIIILIIIVGWFVVSNIGNKYKTSAEKIGICTALCVQDFISKYYDENPNAPALSAEKLKAQRNNCVPQCDLKYGL